MIVADASALVQAVADSGQRPRDLFERLLLEDVQCPSHVDAEIGQALRRVALTRPRYSDAAAAALHHAGRLVNMRRDIPGGLSAFAWTLRENVSFYDALYVALAVALDAPLLTADGRLARANLPCRVELVA